jgi:hypothetical protein
MFFPPVVVALKVKEGNRRAIASTLVSRRLGIVISFLAASRFRVLALVYGHDLVLRAVAGPYVQASCHRYGHCRRHDCPHYGQHFLISMFFLDLPFSTSDG